MKPLQLVLFLSLLVCTACEHVQQKPLPPSLSADYKKGASFLNSRHDSAYYYLNRVVTLSTDSLQIAQAYNVMAVVENREGDYYGAKEHLLASISYLHPGRENDDYCLVSDYNVLGTTSLNLKNYDTAIDYYDRVLGLAKDDRTKTVALNNKAKVYQEQKRYRQAISIYDSIIGGSRKDKKEYARVLCNLATVQWLADSTYPAAPDLLKALAIRKAENDDWGLNSSYAHLADYYARYRPDSALAYAKEMYGVAGRLQSSEDKLEALEKLILLSPEKAVKPYFAQYRRLKDSLETARNGAKNQFTLIRYDVEKNKADNLRLERENADRRTEVTKQRAVNAAVILVFVLSGIWGVNFYRKRRKKMEWEKERAKEVERFHLSQRVHDVVANGIYRMAREVEDASGMDQHKVADQLWDLYDKSRDIAYQPASNTTEEFFQRVDGILTAYGSAERKILIKGNEEGLWKGVEEKVKEELEPVLQELMINMDKHSGAKNVVIGFDRDAAGLNLRYSDDGVGLSLGFERGKGLKSTENRIAAVGGQVIFGRNSPAGVIIRIIIPNV